MFSKVYWILPLASAIVWFGMLLAMLAYWGASGRPVYPSESDGQAIAYISDVGAFRLKPLFIAGSWFMWITLDLGMIADRWLRHKGKLAPNTSGFQKALSVVSIIAAIAGGFGLGFLSIFNTYQYPKTHDKLLVLFIVGYVVSAILICWEFQRLGIKYRQHRVLRISFWIKLFFILIEVCLAIAFGVLNTAYVHLNPAAVLEWVIAFIFTGYILSFVLDLLPAISTRHHHSKETMVESGYYGSNQTNGQTYPTQNGSYYNQQPSMGQVDPGRNF